MLISLNLSIFPFFFFLLVPGVRSFAPTNPGGAQALGKEFLTGAPWLNQGANPQFDSPKEQFASMRC